MREVFEVADFFIRSSADLPLYICVRFRIFPERTILATFVRLHVLTFFRQAGDCPGIPHPGFHCPSLSDRLIKQFYMMHKQCNLLIFRSKQLKRQVPMYAPRATQLNGTQLQFHSGASSAVQRPPHPLDTHTRESTYYIYFDSFRGSASS